MDQPTAEKALKELDVLIGEWELEAVPPNGEPWPGEARASFQWIADGRLLQGTTEIEMPEAPNSISVYGCDAANGTYFQLYTDDRNVCRVYEMTIGDGKWTLEREGEPFNQRFSAEISDDGKTIAGRWETDEGEGWRTDFDLTYRKVA
jgi:hypothetical protein